MAENGDKLSPPPEFGSSRSLPSFATKLDLRLLAIPENAKEGEKPDEVRTTSTPVLPTPRSMSAMLEREAKKIPTLEQEALELRTDGLGRSWIVSGTVYSIVQYLLGSPKAELRDLHSFLLMHRLILDPKLLWAYVVQLLFDGDWPETGARGHVVDLILAWVDRCAAMDFFSRSEKVAANPLWKGAHELMARLMKEKQAQQSKRILDKIKEKSKDMPTSVQTTTDDDYRGIVWGITQTLFPRSLEPGQFSFDDLRIKEVANCMTLTETSLFKKIRVREFVEKSWVKSQNSSLIYVMTARFNYVAFWVGTQILSRESLSGRRQAIEKFVSIANECIAMHNYNSAMEVLAGLCMSPISRLKRTWETVSDVALATFRELEDIMSPMRNYNNYRLRTADLRRHGRAYMPYIGLYLKDLIFADENPSWLDESLGILNFEKLDLISQIITEVEWIQRQPAVVGEVPESIVQYLNNLRVLDEKDLYERSLELEPRAKS